MKTSLLALVILFSSTAFARQYIQCSTLNPDTTDVMVVNLQTEKGGTLFLSSGVQNPEDERVLVNIELDKIQNGKHVFKVVNEGHEGNIAIPSEVIGKSVNQVMVDLRFSGYQFEFACFARIYND